MELLRKTEIAINWTKLLLVSDNSFKNKTKAKK